jgi:hypothetical protein
MRRDLGKAGCFVSIVPIAFPFDKKYAIKMYSRGSLANETFL